MRCAWLLLLAIPLLADTYQVTKMALSDGKEIVSANYRQGNKFRSSDQNQIVQITDSDQNTTYTLDTKSREYTEEKSTPGPFGMMMSLAQSIARPPRVHESGKAVNIYYDVTDTGERRQLLGQTARHLLIQQRQVAEPGACQASRNMQTDGWYISGKDSQKSSSSYAIVQSFSTANRTVCRDKIFLHRNATPTGLAVIEHRNNITTEILERSNAPLDPTLFEVPPGYKKVDELPGMPAHSLNWSQEFQMGWGQLEQAVESWFD